MPLYNIENPIQKAMTGLNNAANTYSRMDRKKPNTQRKDPMAPVKTAVALGETAYQGYSLYDSMKSSLTPESGGKETPWDGPNYDNGESGGQAMSTDTDVGDGIGDDFFSRDNTANIQDDSGFSWDGQVDSTTAMQRHEPTIDTTPTTSNAGANGQGPNLNPSLTNNPSLNQGINAQTLDVGSGSGGGVSTTKPASTGATQAPEPTAAMTTDPSTGATQLAVPEGIDASAGAEVSMGTETTAATTAPEAVGGVTAMTEAGATGATTGSATAIGSAPGLAGGAAASSAGAVGGTATGVGVGAASGGAAAGVAGGAAAGTTVGTTAATTIASSSGTAAAGGAASGAASGASTGSTVGPWGAAIGAVVGVVAGALLS